MIVHHEIVDLFEFRGRRRESDQLMRRNEEAVPRQIPHKRLQEGSFNGGTAQGIGVPGQHHAAPDFFHDTAHFTGHATEFAIETVRIFNQICFGGINIE